MTKLIGTKANDALIGTEGHDVIKGRGGSDTIVGLGGADLLVGGKGADTFVLIEGQTLDIIKDFKTGVDNIYVDDLGLMPPVPVIDPLDPFAIRSATPADYTFDGFTLNYKGADIAVIRTGLLDHSDITLL